ncbi:hypothetical protein BGX30_003198 [Mortierella sp. GBA39]|nr:hypothetical protein BGX30_003198 [Mortierella sp. GBA39]
MDTTTSPPEYFSDPLTTTTASSSNSSLGLPHPPPHESDSLLGDGGPSSSRRHRPHPKSLRRWFFKWSEKLFNAVENATAPPQPRPPPPPLTKIEVFVNVAGGVLMFTTIVLFLKGDVFVSQSYNTNTQNITINVSARASSTDILQAVTLSSRGTILHDAYAEADVYLNMNAKERKEAFRKGCTSIRVDILFPANLPSYQSLQIQNPNRGGVHVKLSGSRAGNNVSSAIVATKKAAERVMVLDRLDVRVNAGWVTLNDVVVSNELRVVSSQGGINAQVDVHRQAVLKSEQKLNLQLGSFSREMNVNVLSQAKAHVVMIKYE